MELLLCTCSMERSWYSTADGFTSPLYGQHQLLVTKQKCDICLTLPSLYLLVVHGVSISLPFACQSKHQYAQFECCRKTVCSKFDLPVGLGQWANKYRNTDSHGYMLLSRFFQFIMACQVQPETGWASGWAHAHTFPAKQWFHWTASRGHQLHSFPSNLPSAREHVGPGLGQKK